MLFTNAIQCGMQPAFSISPASHRNRSATSKSQQTSCTYQMRPAYPNDKIINLLRLVDSLVRQQFEFIPSGDQSLFQPTLQRLYYAEDFLVRSAFNTLWSSDYFVNSWWFWEVERSCGYSMPLNKAAWTRAFSICRLLCWDYSYL